MAARRIPILLVGHRYKLRNRQIAKITRTRKLSDGLHYYEGKVEGIEPGQSFFLWDAAGRDAASDQRKFDIVRAL